MKKIFSLILFTLLCYYSFSQTKKEETEFDVYGLFDVSLEDLLDVGMVSASQKKQSVLDAPANAYIVTREQIESRGYSSLVDLLEDIPQVELQINSNPEIRNHATVRGIPGNEKFLILLNGIRITPATGDFYTLGRQYSLVNAKRVEVIIGPASALYGADAFSGIINIITLNRESDGSEPIISARSDYGSYGTTDNSLLLQLNQGDIGFMLGANYYQSNEPDYNNIYTETYGWYNNQYKPSGLVVESPWWGEVYDVGEFENWASESFHGESLSRDFLMPSQSHYVNAELRTENFTIGFLSNSERHSSAYGLKPIFTTYDPDAWIETNQFVGYAQFNYSSFNKKVNLQSSLEYSQFEINPESHYANALSRWQRGYVYGYSKSAKIKEQLQWDPNDKITLVSGFSAQFFDALPRTALSPKPLDKSYPVTDQDLYYIGAAGYENYTGDGFYDSLTIDQKFYFLKYSNLGAYSQLQYTPSKKLEITLGGRFDYNSRYGSIINPRAGVVYKPSSKIILKVLYGQSFLAPSPTKTFMQSGAFYLNDPTTNEIYADYFHVPNPDLEPEYLSTLELSGSWFITPNLSLMFNGYYSYIYNLIDIYADAYEEDVNLNLDEGFDAAKLEVSANKEDTDIFGVTVSLNHLFKRSEFQLNSYLSGNVITGGTWGNLDYSQDIDYWDSNYEFLYYQAFSTIKAGFDLKFKDFSFSSQWRFRDFTPSKLTNYYGETDKWSDPYIVGNLNIGYKILSNDKLDLKLNTKITNVMNTKYYHVYVGTNEGMNQVPQDPRRINAGIQLNIK